MDFFYSISRINTTMTPLKQPVASLSTPSAPRKAQVKHVDGSPLVLASVISDTSDTSDTLSPFIAGLAIDDAVRVLDFSSTGEEA